MTTTIATTIKPFHVDVCREAAAHGNRWQAFHRVMTHTHTYSGRDDHGGTTQPPLSYRGLADWAERMGIEALGMGSPYTPGLVHAYRRFDVESPHLYYNDPSFDRLSVRGDGEIQRMLEEINAISGGRTRFYLDNETPKGRYGHLWWVGYHLDFPAWHDYDQIFDQWMCRDMAATEDIDEPMPYERRPYRQIVAMQRKAGALGFWAHPTSWWRGDDGRFITNIASEMPAHAVADGYVDGMVIMGYRSWRPEYMGVWFMMLDRGYRVTGVAEEDCGLSREQTWQRPSAMTNHVHVEGDDLSVAALTKGFASGRLTATNGPMLDLTVDGQPMGNVARTAAGRAHRVKIWIDPMEAVGRLDLVSRGGEVVWEQEVRSPTVATLEIGGTDQRSYLVARFRADESRRDGPAAVSNPVYLLPHGQGFEQPTQTRLRLKISSDSPFCGGTIRFERADGVPIGSARLTAGAIEETLPASGRFTLIAPDGATQSEYLINANTELTRLQRYLYRGRFLRDYPHLKPGEVPPEAWGFDAHVEAMRDVNLNR
jgi:hypothetical protein